MTYHECGFWLLSISYFTPQINCSTTELGSIDTAIKLLLELNIMYSRNKTNSYNNNFATMYCILNYDFGARYLTLKILA